MAWGDAVAAKQVLQEPEATESFVPTDLPAAKQVLKAPSATDSFVPTDTASGVFIYLGTATVAASFTDTANGLFVYKGQATDTAANWDDTVDKNAWEGTVQLSYPNLTDSFSATDVTSATSVFKGDASDAQDFLDATSAISKFLGTPSDTQTFSQTASAISRCRGAATDSLSVGEDVIDGASAKIVMRGTASDSVTSSDDLSGLFKYLGQATDNVSLGLSDLVSGTWSIEIRCEPEDQFVPTEGILGTRGVYYWHLDDDASVGFNDLISIGGTLYPITVTDLVDAFAPSDSASGIFRYRVSAMSDVSSTFAETVSGSWGIQIQCLPEDEFYPTEGTISVRGKYLFDLSESAPAIDQVEGATPGSGGVWPLSYADVSDTFTALDIFNWTAGIGDSHSFSDTCTFTESELGLIGEYDLTMDDDASAGFGDAAASTILYKIGDLSYPNAGDDSSLGLTDQADLIKSFLRNATDDSSIGLMDDVDKTLVYIIGATPLVYDKISDAVGVSDEINALLRYLAKPSDTFIPSHAINGLFKHYGQMGESWEMPDAVNAQGYTPIKLDVTLELSEAGDVEITTSGNVCEISTSEAGDVTVKTETQT